MSTIKVNRFENTSSVGYGAVLQVVNTQTGAVATGTTTIPIDDTIPQNTEGTEFMTLAITPKSATNKLKITVIAGVNPNGNLAVAGALFQDSTANAIAASVNSHPVAGAADTVVIVHYMTAGTTSSTTFKFRAGPSSAGTVTFNGAAGGRYFGGVFASSITIEEIQV